MTMFSTHGGTPVSIRGSGTTLGSATFTASTLSGAKYYVTDIGGSTSGTAAIVKVLISGTVVWQIERAASGDFHFNFQTPLIGTKGQEITATLDGAGTSIINVSGFRVSQL